MYPRCSSIRVAPTLLLLELGGLATKSLIGAASMLALSSEVTVCSELSSPYLGFPLKDDNNGIKWIYEERLCEKLLNLVNFEFSINGLTFEVLNASVAPYLSKVEVVALHHDRLRPRGRPGGRVGRVGGGVVSRGSGGRDEVGRRPGGARSAGDGGDGHRGAVVHAQADGAGGGRNRAHL